LTPKYGTLFTVTAAHKEIGIDRDTFTQFDDYWLNLFNDIYMYNPVLSYNKDDECMYFSNVF